MCVEISFEEAAQRKRIRYADIVEQARLSHYNNIIAKLITVEVGSRGIVNMVGFLQLEDELNIQNYNGSHKDSNSRVTV